jgi:hypothetical protein
MPIRTSLYLLVICSSPALAFNPAHVEQLRITGVCVGCDLSDYVFPQSADLRRADLSSANLSRATFEETKLDGANLKGAILSGTNMAKSSLIGSNLVDANLESVRLEQAIVTTANFTAVSWIDFLRQRFGKDN